MWILWWKVQHRGTFSTVYFSPAPAPPSRAAVITPTFHNHTHSRNNRRQTVQIRGRQLHAACGQGLTRASEHFYSSQSLTLLPTHGKCRGCLFSLDHTQTHTTVGRSRLDEGSTRCRDLYVTTQTLTWDQIHTTVGFEPTIPASARPQTYALDRAATGIGRAL
jgi:hypothetical protein